jgi:hypothetical protein
MRPRLVLFGDSITELSFASGGWGAALTDRFARQVRALPCALLPGSWRRRRLAGWPAGLDLANPDLAVTARPYCSG